MKTVIPPNAPRPFNLEDYRVGEIAANFKKPARRHPCTVAILKASGRDGDCQADKETASGCPYEWHGTCGYAAAALSAVHCSPRPVVLDTTCSAPSTEQGACNAEDLMRKMT